MTMKLTPELITAPQTRLMMTPALRQAIAILQMSALELNEYLQKALEENPLLEESYDHQEKADSDFDQEWERDLFPDKIEEWLEYFNDRDIGLTVNDKETKSLESYLSRRPTLLEHLQFQLHVACAEELDLKIGDYLIGCIDASGYLRVEIQEVARLFQVSAARVDKVLSLIKTFHPHGVGAKDLQECLLIQLDYWGKDDPLYKLMVTQYLDEIGKGSLNRIATELGQPVSKVQEACDFIRNLDPRPGLSYSDEGQVKYLVPDITVEKIDDEYIVIVNDALFPHLVINPLYADMLRQRNAYSPEAQKYLEEKMNSALWLIKSLDQRRITLYKVARCLVDIQREFLDKGVKYLKPLTLKMVADCLDIHESTVSRATANKYIQTPQGILELRYFFSSSLKASEGSGEFSSTTIKSLLEEIVAGENSSRPLSDQAIADILQGKGIKLSRRTVAKYRQELGIPSTVSRKRY